MNNNKKIFNLSLYKMDIEALAKLIARKKFAAGSSAFFVLTANIDHVVNIRRNSAFRSAYQNADIVTADGMPVYIYAKIRGIDLKGGPITGADLLPEVLKYLHPLEARLLFVVSDIKTVENLKIHIKSLGLVNYMFNVPNYGFESNTVLSSELINSIVNYQPSHLIFCLGSPKSEIWLYQNRDKLKSCCVLPFGAAANFLAGTQIRAPLFLRKLGLEWVWRFINEPRRLFRRYFIDSWEYLFAVIQDLSDFTRND